MTKIRLPSFALTCAFAAICIHDVTATRMNLDVPDSDEKIRIETRIVDGAAKLSALHLQLPNQVGDRSGQFATLWFDKKGLLKKISVTGIPRISYHVTYNPFGFMNGVICTSGCEEERNLRHSFQRNSSNAEFFGEEEEHPLTLMSLSSQDMADDDFFRHENFDAENRHLAIACSDCETVVGILCQIPIAVVCGAALLVPLPVLAKYVLGLLCGVFAMLCPIGAKQVCNNNFGCDGDNGAPDEDEEEDTQDPNDCVANELEKAGIPASCSEYMGGAYGLFGEGGLCLAQCSGSMPPLVRYACNKYCSVPCQDLDLEFLCPF